MDKEPLSKSELKEKLLELCHSVITYADLETFVSVYLACAPSDNLILDEED